MIERSGPWVGDIEVPQPRDATTIRQRRLHLAGNRDASAALSAEPRCRVFECVLATMERVFRHCGHMVWQVQLARRLDAVPLTRDDL